MAQEAYNFAHFETSAPAHQSPAQQTQATRLRSVKGGKQKQSAFQKVFGNIAQALLVVIFFVTAFMLVQSEATLTEYSQQIQSESSALSSAKGEYSYLEATLNASINLDEVEKVAKELGLVKVDESQITYLRIEDEAVLTTVESSQEKWNVTIKAAIARLLEYLDP